MANVLKHRFVSPKTDGGDTTQVQASNWNDGHLFTGGTTGDVLVRDTADAVYGANWTGLGRPVDIPYNGANFNWTVTSQHTFSYAMLGAKVMLLTFSTDSSSLGSPVNSLQILYPAGLVGSRRSNGVAFVSHGGVWELCIAIALSNQLVIQRNGQANFTTGAIQMYVTAIALLD
jgi:hypothetical protein